MGKSQTLVEAINAQVESSQTRADVYGVMADAVQFALDVHGQWGEEKNVPEEVRERARLIRDRVAALEEQEKEGEEP